MWLKHCYKPAILIGMVYTIPPIGMVMTGGWFMELFYPRKPIYRINPGEL